MLWLLFNFMFVSILFVVDVLCKDKELQKMKEQRRKLDAKLAEEQVNFQNTTVILKRKSDQDEKQVTW